MNSQKVNYSHEINVHCGNNPSRRPAQDTKYQPFIGECGLASHNKRLLKNLKYPKREAKTLRRTKFIWNYDNNIQKNVISEF